MTRTVNVAPGVFVGGGRALALIAGPDVIESERHAVEHAGAIREMTARLGIPYIFKSSYDKANRSSGRSFRGPGLKKGLAILKKVRQKAGVPVLSDVHETSQVAAAAQVLDVIQIPAFLCRQTDLIVAAARTRKVVNIKKGQFLAPWDIQNAIDKARSTGNRRILVTERGTVFGYNNLVNDMRGLAVMRRLGCPVVFDGTHSVQLPGGLGTASGGQREFVAGLVRAACGMGCDALFLEVHKAPDRAPCDGPIMVPLGRLEELLRQAKRVHEITLEAERREGKKP